MLYLHNLRRHVLDSLSETILQKKIERLDVRCHQALCVVVKPIHNEITRYDKSVLSSIRAGGGGCVVLARDSEAHDAESAKLGGDPSSLAEERESGAIAVA